MLWRELLGGPLGLLLDRGEAGAPVPLQELAIDLKSFFLVVVVVVVAVNETERSPTLPSLLPSTTRLENRKRTSHSAIFA